MKIVLDLPDQPVKVVVLKQQTRRENDMITFGRHKVTANEFAKLSIYDNMMNVIWEERLGDHMDDYSKKEWEAIQQAFRNKEQTVRQALGIEKLCEKLNLWQ